MISAIQKTQTESQNPVRNLQFNAECHGTCQSLDEFIKSIVITLIKIMIWTIICKYFAAKVDLNINPACSARLCMNVADARFCLLTLHKQNACSLNEDINI